MTWKEFWLGIFLFGSIVQPAMRWAVKKAWIWFVHRSEKTIRIWYKHKKASAQKEWVEAVEILKENAG